MSLQRSLQIALRPSRRLTVALAVVHVGLALSLLPLPWSAGWRAAGMAAVLAGAVPGILVHARRCGRSAVVRLEVLRDGRLRLHRRDGGRSDGVVRDDSIVTPCLTVIGVRIPGKWRSTHVVVVPDAIDREDFRRLRVRLRWPPSQGAEPADSADGTPPTL